jgi:hypothetical protein
MSNQTRSGHGWHFWIGMTIVGLAVLTIFFVLLRPNTPPRITVTTDSNGNVRLGGVPLLTTNIRDGAFVTMGRLGIKAGLAVPSPPTNDAQASNILQTLQSMNRAGLLSTNPPPNPYE